MLTRQGPFVRLAGNPNPTLIAGQPRKLLGTPVPAVGPVADGVWACWDWDGTTLTVQNDRLGFFPLYYSLHSDGISVSPSIPALLALGAPRTLDEDGLSVFLRLGFFIGSHTPFKAIKALPPGATLRWRNGYADLSHVMPRPTTLAIGRESAMQIYADLFQQAIQRRSPEGRYAVPLSGGRDSRHILLELHRQGFRPHCATIEYFDRHYDQDRLVAARLTQELSLPLAIVRQDRALLAAEIEKNERTNYCADEHAWYLPISDHLEQHFDVAYDGIGGDVLSAGLFLDRKALALTRAGRFEEMADRIAHHSESALMRLLSPALRSRVPRRQAIASIASELAHYADWPNPVGAFFFFNRTRREIALAPYRLIDQRLQVHAPYLDRDLFDFLAALPAEYFLDQQFHTQTIALAYPRYAHIPYSSDMKLRPSWSLTAAQAMRLLPLLLQQRTRTVVNRRALALRLAKCLINRSYGWEFVRSRALPAVYLMQLATAAEMGEPPDDLVPAGYPVSG